MTLSHDIWLLAYLTVCLVLMNIPSKKLKKAER